MLDNESNILIFFTEARIFKCNSKSEYYADLGFSYKTLNRYLTVFKKVILVCRVQEVSYESFSQFHRIDNDQIEVFELPYYVGLIQFLKVRHLINFRILKLIRDTEQNNYSFISRLPGNIGNLACSRLRKRNQPYGVEVVGDPWDVFAPESVKHPFRVIFRYWFTYLLKKNVKTAISALYVTKDVLQNRYPISNNAFSTHASNVALTFECASISKELNEKKKFTIISIGSLDQMYKGPDVLLKSLSICASNNLQFNFIWLGEGIYKDQMINLSSVLKISKYVSFPGNVKTDELLEKLRGSDLFVMASKTEGLPRAMIEAMSQGLPCIGTKVGGIPELLENDVLVETNNPQELAEKIMEILGDKKLYDNQALKCLQRSQEYHPDVLEKRRNEFYKSLAN